MRRADILAASPSPGSLRPPLQGDRGGGGAARALASERARAPRTVEVDRRAHLGRGDLGRRLRRPAPTGGVLVPEPPRARASLRARALRMGTPPRAAGRAGL